MDSPYRTSRALIMWCVAPFLFLSIPRSVLGQSETWGVVASVVASDASEGGGNFGEAVAVSVSGTTMVVGDWSYDGQKGRAYVFSLNVDAFEEAAVLLSKETTSFYGWAVDIDGETIVVGADGSDAAFVFVKNGGEWPLQQKLNISVADGTFGKAVAVGGDRILAGAKSASSNIGAAYIFERSGTTWIETTILTPSDNVDNGRFGYAVDV
jgi:hypothetical protein